MMRGFVGVDWGSSRFRAYLFDRMGQVLDTCGTDDGLLNLQSRNFEDVLRIRLDPWRERFDTIYLSGMVTSRSGWTETEYLQCPVDLGGLSDRALSQDLGDWRLVFLPGLCVRGERPDVMRGEEVQLLGLDLNRSETVVVLPGTHSKWVRMANGQVVTFRTIVTGEMFALLLGHSLIGQAATESASGGVVFRDAVQAGYGSETPIADLFSLRASVMVGAGDAADVATRLSGHLMGCEIREAMSFLGSMGRSVRILGATGLAERYAEALDAIGVASELCDEATTSQGFARIAKRIDVSFWCTSEMVAFGSVPDRDA